MRKLFENYISLLVSVITLILCCRWYNQSEEIEPLIGIVAAIGVLLTGIVFRIFPEKKEEPPAPIEISTKQNVVEQSTVNAGENAIFGNQNTIQQTFITYDQQEIPRSLTPPPFRAEVFLGREADLQTIHDRLFSGEHLLLLVNGEGGVGKTTLAARYYHLYQNEYAHTAWVLSEKNLAAALLLLTEPLGLTFEERMPTIERLPLLLRNLANLDTPCLLVIDNANEVEDLYANYQLLRQCSNFHLLLTTRIAEFAQAAYYRIEGLPEDKAWELFQKHYPKWRHDDEALFKQIRTAVGGNTLVIELLAKNLAQFNRIKTHYTLTNLLSDLQKKGLLALSQSQPVGTDYQSRGGVMRHEKPEDIISAMYDLGDLPPVSIALLSVFAVLPAESIGLDMLETLLPDFAELETTLITLSQTGWLAMEETKLDDETEEISFKCSPVVQEIVKVKNREELSESCRGVTEQLLTKLDYETGTGHFLQVSYVEATVFARYAETLVKNNFSTVDYGLSILCERIGSFHQTTGNLHQALIFFEHSNKIEKELYASDAQNINFKNGLSISYLKLGNTHRLLGNMEQSLICFELSNQLDKELYETYPQNSNFKNSLAISYQKLGDIHTDLGHIDQTLDFSQRSNQLFTQLHAADLQNIEYTNNLAISYFKLGETYTILGYLDQALPFFTLHNQLEKELYKTYPENMSFKNSLAISCGKLGETYTALGDIDQALPFFNRCNCLEKELFETYPQNISFKSGLAISYSKLGEIHTKLGHLNQALTFFEESSKLRKELYETYPQNVSYKNGLAISYEKLGDTHVMLGNLEYALFFFKVRSQLAEELHIDYPQNVAFKNGLAISYSKLGRFYRDYQADKVQARLYFVECQRFWQALATDHAEFAEFQNNFQWVENALAELDV